MEQNDPDETIDSSNPSEQPKAEPQVSELPPKLSLHSRDKQQTASTTQKNSKKKKKKDSKKAKREPMDLDDNENQEKESSYYYKMTYKKNLDKTFHYKYFRPYSQDYRRLNMVEDCECPIGEIHNTQCQWYHPDTIYVLYTKGDISASEEAAQQKIYLLYLNTISNTKVQCGYGTAAEITYMGHDTKCKEFQYMDERESYEVVLVMMKKRKKVNSMTYSKNANQPSNRPRLLSPKLNVEANEDEVPEVKKVLHAKEIQPILSQEPTDSLSMLAETTSISTQ